jgi:HAD superfamily hydrolase (TIGR01509 family)
VLGLPDDVKAVLFDLDGVLTDTASVHKAAWKEMFDAFLRARAERADETFVPFDARSDYETYVEGSRRYLEAARDAGLRRAVVSSSANTEEVLTVTGLAPLIELRVDGNTIREQGLRGKPAPDTFLHAADLLGVRPDQAAVFEDALAGVEAGRAGKFRRVIGVNRGHHREALRGHGADIVVDDLGQLLEGDE